MAPSIRFRIFPCYQEDAEKTVVRIDEKHLQKLGIKSGDIVMLTGGRKTITILGGRSLGIQDTTDVNCIFRTFSNINKLRFWLELCYI